MGGAQRRALGGRARGGRAPFSRVAQPTSHTRPVSDSKSPAPATTAPPRRRGRFRRAPSDVERAEPERRPEQGSEVERAAAKVAELEQGDLVPALVALTDRLGLTTFERNIVLLCVGAELDTRIGPLCALAQGDAGRAHPTFALALSLFDDAAWEALSADRPLRYSRVIEISQSVGTPLVMSPIRADERIVNYVKGLNQLDDRLAPFFVPITAGASAVALPSSQAMQAEHIGQHLTAAASTGRIPVVHLVGRDASSKQHVALQAGLTLGRHLVRLPAVSLPGNSGDLEQFARLWQRESALLPLALVCGRVRRRAREHERRHLRGGDQPTHDAGYEHHVPRRARELVRPRQRHADRRRAHTDRS